MCWCYSSKDAESNSSHFLVWEDTQVGGPPPSYALHELLQASPAHKPSFGLSCKARANTPLLPKIMAVFPPAQVELPSRNFGTLPPSASLCSFSLKLCSYLLEVQQSVFSILNSCLWKQQPCSLENQTEMNACAYKKYWQHKYLSSMWHRFSLMLTFILLGQ